MFLVAGSAKLHGAGYRDEYVTLRGIDATTQIRMTPAELAVTEIDGEAAWRRLGHRRPAN